MSSGSGGKSKSSQSDRVQIPDFLRPFIQQSTGTAGRALSGLEGALGGEQVAGFAPAQQAAQALAVDRALGGGGLIPGAQDAALGIAGGGGLDLSFLQSLQGMSADPTAMAALQGQAQGGTLPGIDSLQGLLGQGLDSQAVDTLRQTAGGDFLMGGQGFDGAVQAAMRAAQPGILSTFGSAGRGGATGGLAQEAIGTAAVDAFARQFGQERQNQLGAANQLAGLGLQDRGQSADIAGTMAGLGLNQNGQQINAASALGSLGLGGQEQALRAAFGLTDAQLGQQGQQLQAAGMLPGLASADINLLSGVGAEQQDQAQMELDGPRRAQLQLLSAALGGLPISSFLGREGRGQQSGFSFGF